MNRTAKKADPNSPEVFLRHIQADINECIRFADNKALLIVASASALVGITISSSVLDSIFLKPACFWHWWQWSAELGLMFLALAILCSIRVVLPRQLNSSSIGFDCWGSIVRHQTAAEFSVAIHQTTPHERTVATAEHLYTLAAVAKGKTVYVMSSLWLEVAGGILTATALIIQHGLRV